MNKEQIEKIALEVAEIRRYEDGEYSGYDFSVCALVDFATRFLARIDAERLTAGLTTATLERDMRKMAEKHNRELLVELIVADERIKQLEFSWAGCSQQLKDACADLDVAEARCKALEQDAARYRWLRENNIVANVRFNFGSGESHYLYAECLDEAIDAARKEAQP